MNILKLKFGINSKFLLLINLYCIEDKSLSDKLKMLFY